MHQRGITQGRKFTYCPVNHAVSWLDRDYDERWCFTENKFIEDLV
jgi:hypothetical protein